MAQLIRKLKCKFTAADDYKPEYISRDKWMPVVGIESRRKEIKKEGRQPQVIEEFFYLIIDDQGKLRTIAAFNCNTMIDDTTEINPAKLMTAIENVIIIGKVLSEKIAKFPDKENR